MQTHLMDFTAKAGARQAVATSMRAYDQKKFNAGRRQSGPVSLSFGSPDGKSPQLVMKVIPRPRTKGRRDNTPKGRVE